MYLYTVTSLRALSPREHTKKKPQWQSLVHAHDKKLNIVTYHQVSTYQELTQQYVSYIVPALAP